MLVPALAWGGHVLATSPPAEHAAHAAHAVPTATSARDHARWQPDEPLREGMRRMGDAVGALGHHDHLQLGPAQVRKLSDEVRSAAAYMFANCTLEPEPDAILHGMLARLLGGAHALSRDPASTEPLGPMRAALADYARQFDDPDFVVPAEG